MLVFKAAVVANFSEGSYVSVRFEPEWMSEAEHLSLRFKVSFFGFSRSRSVFC